MQREATEGRERTRASCSMICCMSCLLVFVCRSLCVSCVTVCAGILRSRVRVNVCYFLRACGPVVAWDSAATLGRMLFLKHEQAAWAAYYQAQGQYGQYGGYGQYGQGYGQGYGQYGQ